MLYYHVNKFILLFYLYILCVFSKSLVPVEFTSSQFNNCCGWEITPDEQNNSYPIHKQNNRSHYKTVKKYVCNVNDEFNDTHMLIYGTKAWTFPAQDVNLVLSYPTSRIPETMREYLITGLQVIMYTDGYECRGYITSGGMLQETISLSFISRNITMLSYQFWLYGIQKTSYNVTTLEGYQSIC